MLHDLTVRLGILAQWCPLVVRLAVVGLMIALAGALVERLARNASAAARAGLMQSCAAALLAATVAAFAPLRPRSVPPAERLFLPAAMTARIDASISRIQETRWIVATSSAARRSGMPAKTRTAAGVITLIWLAGACCVAYRLAIGAWMLRRLRRRAVASPDGRVLVSDEVDVPSAFGLWRPVILVPASSDAWSAETWRAVIGHERAHIERGDLLMHWVRQSGLVLHWFNPAVRWLMHRAGEACESACDDAVLLAGFGAPHYAETLLAFGATAGHDLPLPVSTFAGGGTTSRVEVLLDARRPRRLARPRETALRSAVGAIAGLSLTIFVPAPAPVWSLDAMAPVSSAVSMTTAPDAEPLRTTGRALTRVLVPRVGTNDTTEALLGLGELLRDPNPIIRESATDALRAWQATTRLKLPPLTHDADRRRRSNAEAVLEAVGIAR